MPDILLIQPPIRDFYLTRKRTLPYGLAAIAASVIQAGFSVQIFDGLVTSKFRSLPLPPEMTYLEPYYGRADKSPFALFHGFRHFGYSFGHIGKIARESKAFLIGISSLFTAYQDEALKTAQTVKKWAPQVHIVMGGHHATAFPREIMASGVVDFVLRGEGEVSLPPLAQALKENHELITVPGIVYRKSDGELDINAPAIQDELDRSPLPALQLVNQKYYRRSVGGSAVVVASRGCPFNCSYCCLGAESAISYRQRSVDSVIAEIDRAIIQHGVRFIDFEDENLALDKHWFLDLLRQIQHRWGDMELELRAMNGLLPTTLDEATIGAMKTAGFSTINLSLGSTSSKQLKHFNRIDVRAAFDRVLHLAEAHNMSATGYIIAGAPGQQAETTLKDLLYLASRRVLIGLSIFYPAPGSADYAECQHQGLLPAHYSLFRASCLPLALTTSRTQVVTLLRLARLLNFMKSLLDSNESLPEPQLFENGSVLKSTDRKEIGIKLLSWFLNDQIIRGVDSEGVIYPHIQDLE